MKVKRQKNSELSSCVFFLLVLHPPSSEEKKLSNCSSLDLYIAFDVAVVVASEVA